jgi:hypothetical protein
MERHSRIHVSWSTYARHKIFSKINRKASSRSCYLIQYPKHRKSWTCNAFPFMCKRLLYTLYKRTEVQVFRIEDRTNKVCCEDWRQCIRRCIGIYMLASLSFKCSELVETGRTFRHKSCLHNVRGFAVNKASENKDLFINSNAGIYFKRVL